MFCTCVVWCCTRVESEKENGLRVCHKAYAPHIRQFNITYYIRDNKQKELQFEAHWVSVVQCSGAAPSICSSLAFFLCFFFLLILFIIIINVGVLHASKMFLQKLLKNFTVFILCALLYNMESDDDEASQVIIFTPL